MTIESEDPLYGKYTDEAILGTDERQVEEIMGTANQLVEQIISQGMIDLEVYIDLLSKCYDHSNLAVNFVESYNAMISENKDNEKNLSDKEKLKAVHEATNQACLSSVISGILEVFYLRKLLRESKLETLQCKKLLDWACDEETKKQLENTDTQFWVKEPKNIQ